MKKAILYLILGVAFLLSACSGNKIEKIPTEIPSELHGNIQAEELIGLMTDAVNDCRAATVKIALASLKSESDSLNLMQSLKVGTVALGFAKAQNKMADCMEKAEKMKESFTEAQYESLMACLNNLQNRSVEIENPEDLGLTAQEFDRLRGKHIATDNIQHEALSENRNGPEESMQPGMDSPDGNNDPPGNPNEIEMPGFMHVLFPVVVIGLIVFLAVRRVKKFFSKIYETGYTISSIRGKIDEAKVIIEQDGDKSAPEYHNAKKALNFIDKFTNKSNK